MAWRIWQLFHLPADQQRALQYRLSVQLLSVNTPRVGAHRLRSAPRLRQVPLLVPAFRKQAGGRLALFPLATPLREGDAVRHPYTPDGPFWSVSGTAYFDINGNCRA